MTDSNHCFNPDNERCRQCMTGLTHVAHCEANGSPFAGVPGQPIYLVDKAQLDRALERAEHNEEVARQLSTRIHREIDRSSKAELRAQRAEEALQSAYKDVSRLRLALIYIRDFVRNEIQPEQGGHVYDYLQTANNALEATRDSGI